MANSDVRDALESTPSRQSEEPVINAAPKVRKPRTTDGGPEILPAMGSFVNLARKIRHRPLVAQWLSVLQPEDLPEVAWNHKTAAHYKQSLFKAVAQLPGATRQRLEEAAQRILLLSDTHGGEAVKSLLDAAEASEQAAVEAAGDKYARALYLYLCRLATPKDRRFEQAEMIRQQVKQWQSEAYASHFRGPKGLAIRLDAAAEAKLKDAMSALYPQASDQDMIVEHFTRRDLRHADAEQPTWLHTILVGFNGRETHWDKLIDGEVTTRHDQALQRILFSYEPSSGGVSVFCEDKSNRRDLARALRDSVLASDTEIADLPLLEFSLAGFETAAIFQRLITQPGDGIERVSINLIKVAKPVEQHDDRGTLTLSSHLTLRRDRRDQRNVYTVAYEDYGLNDLSQWTLRQIKLVLRRAKQPDQQAHNINLQITTPNGLSEDFKTEQERQLVMGLLKRWHIATEL